MNPVLLAGIIALAIAATGAYFFGRRKNKALAGIMSKEAEKVLHAKSTEYVNIGGSIGYNFTYKLADPWTEVKGTMTFIPRQSLLYVPFSYLIGARDRFYINFYTKRKLAGEGHLLSLEYYRKNGGVIDNKDSLTMEEYWAGSKQMVLLYEDPSMARSLKSLADGMVGIERLRHFCVYPANKTIFLFLHPKAGAVGSVLESILPRMNTFFTQKGD
jgi:hypothetical protein